MDTQSAEKHIQLVGILNIVYRGLGILIALLLFVFSTFFNRVIEYLAWHGDGRFYEMPPPFIMHFIPMILFVVAMCVFIVSAAGIIGGVGVLKKQESGRILLLIVSFLNLLHFPLGTALGVYSIWVLFDKETVKMFNKPESGSPVVSQKT